jgi:hypothetical protein
MALIKVGKPDVSPDLMAHTPGVAQGNARGNYDAMVGHRPDGRSSAERSTGINSADMEPIDSSSPNLSPA